MDSGGMTPGLVVCCLQELAHTERGSPSPVHKAAKCQSQNTEKKRRRDEYNYEREIPFGVFEREEGICLCVCISIPVEQWGPPCPVFLSERLISVIFSLRPTWDQSKREF